MNRVLTTSLFVLPLLAAACADDTAGDDAADEARAAVVAGDFMATGILSTVGAPTLAVDSGAVAGVAGSDPAIRRIGDELFVINKFGGDNITVLDAATLQLVEQYATGAGSNPQDVAAVGDKLYVPCLDIGELVVIDRTSGDVTGIDLSAVDDDGVPDCVAAHAVGTDVYVACGLLDTFAPVEDAVVVVIDTADDSIATTITLPDQNPVGWFAEAGDDLVLTLQPSFNATDAGCLATITPGTTPTATCAVSSADLGGYVTRAVTVGDQLLAAVMSYSVDFATSTGDVVWIDVAAGTVSDSLDGDGVLAQDLAVCGDHVFVADKAAGAEGIRVFSLAGAELSEMSSAALEIGLPPASGNAIACMTL